VTSKTPLYSIRMSRAFMKESEPGEPVCPGCGTPGDPVGLPTLEAQAPRGALEGPAFYCSGSSCAVAYFNPWGRTVSRTEIRSPAWPKELEAPICPCFGFTAARIVEEARGGRKELMRELREGAAGAQARCAQRSPDGRCCLERVERLFRESFDPAP
jgi:hypothetical protein